MKFRSTCGAEVYVDFGHLDKDSIFHRCYDGMVGATYDNGVGYLKFGVFDKDVYQEILDAWDKYKLKSHVV